MLELIAGTLYMFLIAMITYYAGVLVWEERDSNNDEVQDALPVPEWPTFAAKFVALMCSIAIILAVVMVTAMLVQFFHHYHRYQIGLVHREPCSESTSARFHLSGHAGVLHSCPLA